MFLRNNINLLLRLVLALFFCLLGACSLFKEKKYSDTDPDIQKVVSNPLPPEKADELLGEVGSNWLYGSGLGETAVAAGSIVVFPPYALYVLGNGILSLSGYEPIYVTDALPDEDREQWNEAYDSIVSSPGQLTSAVAGREFRNKEVAKEKIYKVLSSADAEQTQKSNGQNRSGDQAGY